MTDRQPEMQEVYQSQENVPGIVEVPVRVVNPVGVQSMPAVAWTVNRFQATDSTGSVKVSSRNPFRKIIRLISETSGFFFGTSQAQTDGRGNCGFAPTGVVIELTHTEEVWVSNVATQSPNVSVIEEMWTS